MIIKYLKTTLLFVKYLKTKLLYAFWDLVNKLAKRALAFGDKHFPR